MCYWQHNILFYFLDNLNWVFNFFNTAGYRKFKIYAENDKVKPIRSDSVDDEIK